jgi:pilus assembly protein CpaB
MAINDQEAEYIEFARASDARVTLVLRGANDDQLEETTGASLDLLVTDLGLPVPEPLLPPAIVSFPDPTIPGP